MIAKFNTTVPSAGSSTVSSSSKGGTMKTILIILAVSVAAYAGYRYLNRKKADMPVYMNDED